MRRFWVITLWCLLGAPAAAQDLVIATTGTFPPYLYEEGDSFSGFDIDLMDEICRRNGFTCEYRAYAVLPGLEAVARGEADIALGGLGISTEREAYGTFTCPYRQGNVANVPIFALSPSVDPATARIAVLGDSLSHQALIGEGYTAVPFDDLASAITSVLNGETDAYHGNPNSLNLVEGAPDKLTQIGSVQGRGSGAAFLVSSARPRLVALLNDSFAILHRDGHLQEMGDRWFGPGRFQPPEDIGVDCGMVMSAR
jgi:ABC-type amino acid transport substrate-binding protein